MNDAPQINELLQPPVIGFYGHMQIGVDMLVIPEDIIHGGYLEEGVQWVL